MQKKKKIKRWDMFLGDSDLKSYDHLDTAYILIFCAIWYPYYCIT